MERIKLSELAAHFNLELTGQDCWIENISIDTRTLQVGDCYLALVGENFDGHDFITAAKTNGASACIVDHPVDTELPQLIVKDTKRFLSELAAFQRQQFTGTLIAITGSCGKTTVKELTAQLLSVKYSTLKTQGNFNNEVGMPLTLLRLMQSHEVAVIEMGANHIGEIGRMSAIAKPDIAAIININPVHLEGFGSLAGVAQGKGEIYLGLNASGLAIMPENSPYQAQWLKNLSTQTYQTVGLESDGLAVKNVVLAERHSEFTVLYNGQTLIENVYLPLVGQHNVENALFAIQIALTLDVTPKEIKKALSEYKPIAGRMTFLPGLNGAEIIDDCYNANPKALEAALSSFVRMSKPNKWLVLADMGELGPDAIQIHKQAGHLAKSAGVSRLVTYGPLALNASQAFGAGATHFDSKSELIEQLKSQMNDQTIILIKGSKFMNMPEVVTALRQLEGSSASC